MHSHWKSHKMKTDSGKINRPLFIKSPAGSNEGRRHLAHTYLLLCYLTFFYSQEKVNKQKETKTKAISEVAKDEHSWNFGFRTGTALPG